MIPLESGSEALKVIFMAVGRGIASATLAGFSVLIFVNYGIRSAPAEFPYSSRGYLLLSAIGFSFFLATFILPIFIAYLRRTWFFTLGSFLYFAALIGTTATWTALPSPTVSRSYTMLLVVPAVATQAAFVLLGDRYVDFISRAFRTGLSFGLLAMATVV